MRNEKTRKATPIARLLWLLATCILVAVAVPLGYALAHEWSTSRAAHEALLAFRGFRAALLVMEKVSVERGPTNGALGEDLPMPPARAQALARARAESDRRIANLAAVMQEKHCPDDCKRESAAVDKMRIDLASARAQVDALIAKPLAERHSPEIHKAVEAMIAIISEVAPPLDGISLSVREGGPGTFNWLATTRLLADLREFAGQLGSQFTAALAAQRPLTHDELLTLERVRGRVDQLHTLVLERMNVNPGSASARAALADMERSYFVTGIRYAEYVQAIAVDGPTGISAARFAADYVPPMGSITRLRDVLLDQAEADLHARQTESILHLLVVLATALVIVGALVMMMLTVRKRVVEPLLHAASIIDAIANDTLDTEIHMNPRSMEVAKLLGSIVALNASHTEKMKLENLLLEMRELAETDPLTGLLNRNALKKRVKTDWRASNPEELAYAVVRFDIDNFKRTNDTYGHSNGDRALRTVAHLCRQTWQHTDIVARDGDTFAVLMRVPNEGHAIESAERMRGAIEHTPILVQSGGSFSLTASFGVAYCDVPGRGDVESLIEDADRLLRQAKELGRNCVVTERSLAQPS
ncbi:GGDEF domain-containing protein [Burkholderia lata]|uniref:GGDEF domain-containing protein n=1 Tax=Burkholderia lata (strain ATCC 17760 / DSM 23089 / LMG 22485 / NCIMB 9086 / R18194 / 383) TaxID=482957 RepID=UPI00145496F5|nr:GGDEF domain-containing protein [Burkholderia lata]VWB88212.1 ATPase [Burkholderia lata]